jgi:pyruvyltransferase
MKLNRISRSFFINLDRRKDRLDHINKNLPFSAERFPAINAKELELNQEIKNIFKKSFNKLTKAEIACALSHYRLWKQLTLDREADNYLILEDDVVFKKGFTNSWNQVYSNYIPNNYNLIYLGGCQPWNKPHYHKVTKEYNNHFFNIKKNNFFSENDHYWHMNASSYILSKQAASTLCQWVEQGGINEALDNFMQKFFNQNKLFSAPNSIYHLNPLMSYQLHEKNDNPEIDKNSDIRHDKEKFSSKEVTNVSYWRYKKGFGNFGDELNVPIAKFLFGDSVKFNCKGEYKQIKLIGSTLGDLKEKEIVCGAGLHHHSEKIPNFNNEFRCVRGPLTLQCVRSAGMDVSNTYLGDPALLLPMFYKPKKNKELGKKIGLVPHISNIDIFKNLIRDDDRFHLINPTDKWQNVIDKIYSCSAIVSSSLHGLICADAFNIPNLWIKIPGRPLPPCGKKEDYGDFKYLDYFLSQGRKNVFINSLSEDFNNKMYTKGNTIDLHKLKRSITKPIEAKIVFLNNNLYEEDFILELFQDMNPEKVFDIEMKNPQENSVIVYSDIYAKNVNLYEENVRQFLKNRIKSLKEYFNKCKNCILVHLSDEHCYAEIDHYKNFKHVFRQYYRSDAVADNVSFIPLGCKKNFLK